MQAKRLLPFLLAMAFAIVANGAAAQHPGDIARWQTADTPKESVWVFADDSPASEKIDVVVRDGGQVLISANRPTPVKVFTILGQPVASRTIQPGTVRLRLPLRGIYILKAGETTKRINI
ncbi:MAG: hypothetical protein K2M06_07725 [Muribaculaceae bacterium]|nr:hypothetical protein [Muribaculaceae bacterium]